MGPQKSHFAINFLLNLNELWSSYKDIYLYEFLKGGKKLRGHLSVSYLMLCVAQYCTTTWNTNGKSVPAAGQCTAFPSNKCHFVTTYTEGEELFLDVCKTRLRGRSMRQTAKAQLQGCRSASKSRRLRQMLPRSPREIYTCVGNILAESGRLELSPPDASRSNIAKFWAAGVGLVSWAFAILLWREWRPERGFAILIKVIKKIGNK